MNQNETFISGTCRILRDGPSQVSFHGCQFVLFLFPQKCIKIVHSTCEKQPCFFSTMKVWSKIIFLISLGNDHLGAVVNNVGSFATFFGVLLHQMIPFDLEWASSIDSIRRVFSQSDCFKQKFRMCLQPKSVGIFSVCVWIEWIVESLPVSSIWPPLIESTLFWCLFSGMFHSAGSSSWMAVQ